MLIISCILLATTSYGQNTRLLVRNAPDSDPGNPRIQLKWYNQKLLFKEGVNIYRRSTNDAQWKKLNDAPTKQSAVLSRELIQNDPDVEVFSELLTGIDTLDPFLLFQLFVKTFESNEFAHHLGIFFEDQDVEYGLSYQYSIREVSSGNETIIATSENIEAGEHQPGPPPDSVVIAQKGEKISFDWKIDEDRFYAVNIYRSSQLLSSEIRLNNNPILISMVPDSTGQLFYPDSKYFDESISKDSIYKYRICGVDFFGEETKSIAISGIKIDDVTPPMPVDSISSTVDSMVVHLEWSLSKSEDIKEYVLMRSALSDGPFHPLFTTFSSTSYIDSLSIPGPLYYYILVRDYHGNESFSKKIFVDVRDVIPPKPPVGLKVRADTGKLILNWQQNAEGDLKGYIIYRSANYDHSDNYVLLNSEPIASNHYTYVLPKNIKNLFSFKICAVDTSYNKSQPSTIVSAVLPDVIGPEKPQMLLPEVYNNIIKLRWKRNIERDLSGYHIFRKQVNSSYEYVQLNSVPISGAVTSFWDKSALSNIEYTYQMIAIDNFGNASRPSNSVVIRNSKSPILPNNFDIQVRYRRKKKHTTISWIPLDEHELTGHVVFRGYNMEDLRPITRLLGFPYYTDQAIRRGKYYYQVKSYLATGAVVKSRISELIVK